ncbi:MAG: hypothetical protein QMD85_04315, partial [Candidatus Aenigmarchaeota archaeon]|nr:hypothetical protein [Candidatus Aenigmarchaeota archaeon]
PTSFDELEEYESGFYIIENGVMEWIDVKLFDNTIIKINADNKNPLEIESEIRKKLSGAKGRLVLLRISGVMGSGKPSDIDFHSLTSAAMGNGAISVKVNRNALTTKEFEEIKIRHSASIEEMEREIIAEHASQIKIRGFDNNSLVRDLMNSLKAEKQEDETNAVFEERIRTDAKKVLKL